MRTSDEILVFLIRNSAPEYHEHPVSGDGDVAERTPAERLEALLLRVSGTTRYKCPVESLEAFLGESVSFERHLRPLHESGALHFNGVPEAGSYFDKLRYRGARDGVTGRVTDYATRREWVAFHVRGNDFLAHHKQIVDDARNLGLLP